MLLATYNENQLWSKEQLEEVQLAKRGHFIRQAWNSVTLQSLHKSSEILKSSKHRTACTTTISSLNKKCKLSQSGAYPNKLNHISHHMHEGMKHLQFLRAVFEMKTKPCCSIQSMFGVQKSTLRRELWNFIHIKAQYYSQEMTVTNPLCNLNWQQPNSITTQHYSNTHYFSDGGYLSSKSCSDIF